MSEEGKRSSKYGLGEWVHPYLREGDDFGYPEDVPDRTELDMAVEAGLRSKSTEWLEALLISDAPIGRRIRDTILAALTQSDFAEYHFVLVRQPGRKGKPSPTQRWQATERRRAAARAFVLAGGLEKGGYAAALVEAQSQGFSRSFIQKALPAYTIEKIKVEISRQKDMNPEGGEAEWLYTALLFCVD